MIFRWIQKWRHDRLLDQFVRLSVNRMLTEAADRLGTPLSDDEAALLTVRFAKWLDADPKRVDALVSQPVRSIHLFLSEW